MKLVDYIKEKEDIALSKGLEPEAIKKLLIEGVYHSYTNLIMDYNNEINSHYFNIMEDLISKYINERLPIQHILGHANFYGLKLKVNKNVLIPRPETELLVEMAIQEINTNNYRSSLDIGTGSGAIAIAVKKETGVLMTAVDISTSALEVAKENSRTYGLDINFIESDMFSNISGTYDVILSNPPYIAYDDIDNVSKIVYTNEPHLALFSDDNGLYYYKKIIDNLDVYLNPNGVAIMEIGYNQASDIKHYLDSHTNNYQLNVYKDYNNLDRVIIIKRK